jgi:F-type H+-transporting ATPase subunit delta
MRPLVEARRYARALADVADGEDPGRLEAIAGELSLVADVLGRAPQALRFFEDPSVSHEDKEKAIGTLGRKAGTGDLTRRFLRLLIERRHLAALPWIARSFAAIKDQRLGIVPAEATTAVPLSGPEAKRLRESLERMTGRRVRLSLTVDAALLGGARTRIGPRMYDGSLKRKLQILRGRLAMAR